VKLVQIICQEINRVNYWNDANKQKVLLIGRLGHPEISDGLDFIEPLVDNLMEIAKYNPSKFTR